MQHHDVILIALNVRFEADITQTGADRSGWEALFFTHLTIILSLRRRIS
jgi:hypothetical protein